MARADASHGRKHDEKLSRNVLPRSSAIRCVNGLDERLNAQASAEVEWLRSTSSYSVQVARGFDRLQVVEAKLVARRNAEQAVWPMLRACLDPAQSLTPMSVIGRKE